MNAEQIVTYLVGGMYLAIILGFIAFLISVPFIVIAAELPDRWQAARHLTALTGAVVALVGVAAIAGYFLVDASHFGDDARHGNQPYWEMHGEELGYVHGAPVSDDYRREVEAVVSAERRWYAERTALLLGALLAGVYTGYAVYSLDRTRGAPPPLAAAT